MIIEKNLPLAQKIVNRKLGNKDTHKYDRVFQVTGNDNEPIAWNPFLHKRLQFAFQWAKPSQTYSAVY